MNVSLTAELDAFVRRLVQSGAYQSSSEVVRDALRQLMQQRTLLDQQTIWSAIGLADAPKSDADHAAARRRFNAMIDDARQRFERGEGVPGDVAFDRLRAQAQSKRRGKAG